MMVNAMLWILNTGSPWRDLPERYGPWQTAYNRFNRWRRDGTFDAILQRLQIRLDSEGEYLFASLRGLPLFRWSLFQSRNSSFSVIV